MNEKILLADDHSMIRKGIKVLCEARLGMRDVVEAGTCSELMKVLTRGDFTHLILDINFPDGSSLEILPTIRTLYPALRITILSMNPAPVYSKVLTELGIFRYISKSADEEQTIRLLNQFFRNERPSKTAEGHGNDNPFSNFTKRELDILHYLLKGTKTRDISRSLNLKENTISTVKKRIFEKTDTANLIDLNKLASLHNIN